MQGEYRGDFTRDTFDRRNHFARVLMQQGRVQLDADLNEQASILLHYLRELAADLIGPYGGPEDAFAIAKLEEDGKDVPSDFLIKAGHYYVNGILCENEVDLAYANQTGHPFPDSALHKGAAYFAYLDVWERHLAWTENPSIREVALGGPDTATRAKIVWQVKALPMPGAPLGPSAKTDAFENYLREKFPIVSKAALRARTTPASASANPCVIDATARYRGLENQLYRVEIHRGTDAADASKPVTFKWSRDNGSVIFPIVTLANEKVEVANLGRDDLRSLNINDWVEIVDDDLAVRGQPGSLRQVIKVEDRMITLDQAAPDPYTKQSTNHPLLRRWDHRGKASELKDDALPVIEGNGDDQKQWTTLEDGIQVQFKPPAAGEENNYRSGDYWLIPARFATGNVEWPQQPDGADKPSPAFRLPHGVEHHYAPLAAVTFNAAGDISGNIKDLRRVLQPITKP